jgi:hypothetical protein
MAPISRCSAPLPRPDYHRALPIGVQSLLPGRHAAGMPQCDAGLAGAAVALASTLSPRSCSTCLSRRRRHTALSPDELDAGRAASKGRDDALVVGFEHRGRQPQLWDAIAR